MLNMNDFYYSLFNPNPEPYVIPGNYDMKIPVLTDMHLVLKEPGNRVMYIPRQISMLYNLQELLDANNVDIVIDAGDLFDRGEPETSTLVQNHIDNALRGLFENRKSFILKGNHEETYSKNNLFFAYTSITSREQRERLTNKQLILPTAPMFKAVDKITIGDILDIHFMHFDKEKRYYIPPSKRFTIAIFHDDILTLETREKLYHHKMGIGIDIERTNVMENIDIAICGHIHTPMNPITLNNARHTKLIIPGSLCQRTREEVHTCVNIPFICIAGNKVTIEYAPFMLGNIVDTMNIQQDKKNTKQRQMQKEIKKYKERVNNAQTFEEFLDSLTPEERYIIDQADHEITPVAVAKYLTNNF